MYVNKKQAEKIIESFGKELLSQLHERNDFLAKLADDDDWSLLIKSHALIESLITDLIISRINEDKLKSVIERMPLHDHQVSKLKIAKIYDLLSDKELKFISQLSELRNQVVHKFENIDFTFDNYLKRLDNNQKKSWSNAILWFDMSSETKEKYKQLLNQYPSLVVYMSISMFVSITTVKINEFRGTTNIEKAAMTTMENLLNNI